MTVFQDDTGYCSISQERIIVSVTTGTNWRFLQLEQNVACIDRREYYVDNLERLLGILVSITSWRTLNTPVST